MACTDLMGPLMGPQCRLSILRNGNVPCRYFCHFPVDFELVQCRLLNIRNTQCHIFNRFSHGIGFMSPVDLKKRLCFCFEFKGQWPLMRIISVTSLSLDTRLGTILGKLLVKSYAILNNICRSQNRKAALSIISPPNIYMERKSEVPGSKCRFTSRN